MHCANNRISCHLQVNIIAKKRHAKNSSVISVHTAQGEIAILAL